MLKLIEPDEEELKLPEVTFSSIINIPSSDFQKIISDLTGVSERLEIKSVGNELIFKCEVRLHRCEIRRSESGSNMEIKVKTVRLRFKGEFSLKNLSYFIRCTNLCNTIEMLLEMIYLWW